MTRTEHVALKGTRDGLILYLDPTADFDVLMKELNQHLGESAEFWRGAAVRCYAGGREYSSEEKEGLASLLQKHALELSGWLSVPGKGPESQAVVAPEHDQHAQDEGQTEGKALFVKRTLRSGTSIQFEGHVVIMGDVNPGAEVIATGNIIVMGALRGVAHAGATGDRKAMVSAYNLAPTQLRIADLVTRAPKDEAGSEGPEVARIKDNHLIVEGV
ncbi:MAG: septum site-determining protein MinC [Desulfitobacteriaceae bacterium]